MNNYANSIPILIFDDNQGIRTIMLREASYALGRSPYNNIVFLSSKAVSRFHAMLYRTAGPTASEFGYQIVDGDADGRASTNGLMVNGQKCLNQQLQKGDVIVFGSVTVTYDIFAINQSTSPKWQLNFGNSLNEQSQQLNVKETMVNPELSPVIDVPGPSLQDEDEPIPTVFFRPFS